MKLAIVLGLFVVFLASTDALRCKYCEGKTLSQCEARAESHVCQGLEDSCETERRRQGNTILYYQRCKSTNACQNNQANNPRDCRPTDPQDSVCRCCCYSDLCNPNWPACIGGPPTSPTPSPTPSPTASESTTERPPTEFPIDDCFCQPINVPGPGLEVECDESQSNGLFVVGDQCTYICTEPGQIIRPGDNDIRTCRPAFDYEEINAETNFIWVPEEPTCVDDPNICQDAPFWRETPPGPGVVGDIDCGDLSNDEEEYPVGHVCTYSCPAGYHLVGMDTTVCISDPDGGFFNRQSPCCEENCEQTDLLFILDWSSSIRPQEWLDTLNFITATTIRLRNNEELRFGVEVFGQGVRVDLNIPFSAYSPDLLQEMRTIPYNDGRLEGTHANAALQYATNTVFGSPAFNDRPDAKNVVVFVTDGVSTDGRVKDSADALHQKTDTVFSVGIGLNDPDRIKFEENRIKAQQDLEDIAQPSDNILNLDNFDELFESIGEVIDSFCPNECDGFVQ